MTTIRRFIQAIPLHSWRALKWGSDWTLDCRECRWCGRFEIWVVTGYRQRERADFWDVVAV